MIPRKTYIKLITQEQATRATTDGTLIRMTKAKKTRSKTIKDMTRTKKKPEIHHHPEILQLGTIGHPARGEHGAIIR